MSIGKEDLVQLGSQSYSYSIPILSLPGRNGLDLNLALFYNSGIWTVDAVNNRVTFNGDRDFPSYGFRLGFGHIELDPAGSGFVLTEPDGSKRQLIGQTSGAFATVDSSYVDFNNSTGVLRRKDGTQWTYVLSGTSSTFVPTKIQDTNGNYISITYRTDAGFSKQAINTITDTLGRIITFNYDGSGRLQTIVQGTKTWAYFSWNTTYVLKYNFGAPLSVVDSPANNSAQNVLTGCQYPKADASGPGMGYTFTYGDWGIVTQITQQSASSLTRSFVSYNYPASTTALSDHPTFTTQTVNDGATSRSWTYSVTTSGGEVASSTITDPSGTTTTTNLSNGLVASVTVQSGANTLRTITNTWQNAPIVNGISPGPQLVGVMTTLEDGATKSYVAYSYDTNGNVREVDQGDWGLLVKRVTQTDYLNSSAYTTSHILDRPLQTRVYDGASNLVARTDFAYDAGTLTSVTGSTNHDDSGHGASFTTRGNLTSTTRYPSLPSTANSITRSFTYDTLGNLITVQVDCCQLKQWMFGSAYQYAYPTSITRGPVGTQFTSTLTYDFNTGLILSVVDENSKTTGFAYDALNRLKTITRPDSIQLPTVYDDSSVQPGITSTTPVDSGKSVVQVATADGLNNLTRLATNDLGGTTYAIVDRQYDSVGRLYQVSNPYTTGQTPVWTQTQYDALSRVKKLSRQTGHKPQIILSSPIPKTSSPSPTLQGNSAAPSQMVSAA